tara:strand:+ start:51 stop:167 length:117 start_codon:yes stop_codon:yes gene_type:complete
VAVVEIKITTVAVAELEVIELVMLQTVQGVLQELLNQH